ncbi:hypothetical protein ACLKA7_008894 [Drosophila subpalustris]
MNINNKNGRESALLMPTPNYTFPVRTCSNASSLRSNMGHDHDNADDTEEGLGYTHTLIVHMITDQARPAGQPVGSRL